MLNRGGVAVLDRVWTDFESKACASAALDYAFGRQEMK